LIPRQPRLVKVIQAEEIIRKTGYGRPHCRAPMTPGQCSPHRTDEESVARSASGGRTSVSWPFALFLPFRYTKEQHTAARGSTPRRAAIAGFCE
jgi:hypothetical protein